MADSRAPEPSGLPDIPKLPKKRQERERRGGGALLWGAARGTSLLGLSSPGAVAVLLGFGVLTAAAGVAAYRGSRAAASLGTGAPALAGAPSGLRARRAPALSLDYLARANQGQLRFEEAAAPPAAPAAQEPQAEPAKGASAASNAAEQLADALQQPQAGGGFGSAGKLTQDTSQLHSGNLASARLSSGLGGFSGKGGVSLPKIDASKGRLRALPRHKSSLLARGMSTRKGLSPRAMGQLKLANARSEAARSGTAERSSTYAFDAFNQSQTEGGDPHPITGQVPQAPGPNPVAPAIGGSPNPPQGGTNVTPWQPEMDVARGLLGQAGKMKLIAIALLGAGAALIVKARAIPPNHTTAIIIGALLAAGGALLIAGFKMGADARSVANQAKSIAERVQKNYGQVEQGQIIKECADQAAQGVSADRCRPYTRPDFSSTVPEDVRKERDSDYRLGGGPIPGP